MTEDIVDRLRDPRLTVQGRAGLAGEAAEEIESLRAQLAEARTALRMGKRAITAFISIGDRLAVQEPVSRDEIRAGRESIEDAAEKILNVLSKIEGEDQ